MSGTLGTSNPAANTLTTVYTVTTGKAAIFNVSIANNSGYPLVFSLAIASTSTPAASEYIEYNTVLAGNGIYERSGLMASATKNIVAIASTANAAINVFGYEE